MLILSTTYLVEDAVSDSWKTWVRSHFVHHLHQNSADIQQILFCKVHTDAQQDGQTYSMQVQFVDLAALDRFASQIYPACEQLMHRTFSGAFLSFQTVLEEL